MNTVQRIAKNTGVLLASQVVSYAIGFFFVIYTARYLVAHACCGAVRGRACACDHGVGGAVAG